MEIYHKEITVRDLTAGYKNHLEKGVVGYRGRLDIRPPYQRYFVYDDDQQKAVINSVINNFPLNIMYWAVRGHDNYEMIDGQQRTISICQYVAGKFAFKKKYFSNLQDVEREQILDYNLLVYFCKGNNKEKLDWFRIVNIAGEKLTDQELRNATYHGPWLADAKRHFSMPNCVAYRAGKNYLRSDYSPIRQEYLETALKWRSNNAIEEYMGKHQKKPNAKALWTYFKSVINWVEKVFPPENYRREMQGVPWGDLYNDYKEETLDPAKLEKRIVKLMQDDDVTRKKGIYQYVLTGEEKHLSIRAFSNSQKRSAYTRQKKRCAKCREQFKLEEMEADHIKAWSKGGKTVPENCQMLCRECNRRKSNK